MSSCVRHLLADGLGWILVRRRARKGKAKAKVDFNSVVLCSSPSSVFSSSHFGAVCSSTNTLQLQAAMASSCFAEDSFNGAVSERCWHDVEITFNDVVDGCRSGRRPLAGVLGAAQNNLKGAVAAC